MLCPQEQLEATQRNLQQLTVEKGALQQQLAMQQQQAAERPPRGAPAPVAPPQAKPRTAAQHPAVQKGPAPRQRKEQAAPHTASEPQGQLEAASAPPEQLGRQKRRRRQETSEHSTQQQSSPAPQNKRHKNSRCRHSRSWCSSMQWG